MAHTAAATPDIVSTSGGPCGSTQRTARINFSFYSPVLSHSLDQDVLMTWRFSHCFFFSTVARDFITSRQEITSEFQPVGLDDTRLFLCFMVENAAVFGYLSRRPMLSFSRTSQTWHSFRDSSVPTPIDFVSHFITPSSLSLHLINYHCYPLCMFFPNVLQSVFLSVLCLPDLTLIVSDLILGPVSRNTYPQPLHSL